MSQPIDPSLSYDDAVRELQDILTKMQGSELGIDDLTTHIRRASVLLDFCQGKLQKTEAEVQAVLEKLGLEGSV